MSDFRDFIRKVSTSPEELARRELIENASKLSDSIKDHISSEAKSGRFEKIGNRCRIKGYAAICRFDSDSYFGLVYGNLDDVCKYTTDFVGSELDRSKIDWYWPVCGVKTITDSTLFHGWTKEFYITEEENAICDIAKRTLKMRGYTRKGQLNVVRLLQLQCRMSGRIHMCTKSTNTSSGINRSHS